VAVSEAGVVRVNGGKLTTFREMAEDTVDVVVRQLGGRSHGSRRVGRVRTRRLALFGASRRTRRERGDTGNHLVGRFGAKADDGRALIAFDPALGKPLVTGQPYLRAGRHACDPRGARKG
jgi:glycerol-3-phosphate dehydrogenase